MKRKTKMTNKKKMLLTLSALSIIAVVLLVLELSNVVSFFGSDNSTDETVTTTGVEEGSETKDSSEQLPTTNQSPNSPDDAKSNAIAEQNQQQSNQKRKVVPVITSASKDFVIGYVPAISEETGTCTFTFTGNGTTIIKKTAGIIDVSKTNCSVSPNLSGSGWSVVLSYDSPVASGESGKTKVQ